MGELIDFFYTIYSDGSADYYGVAVEDGRTVEWSAAEDADGNGGVSNNYFKQMAKYGDPQILRFDGESVEAAHNLFDDFVQQIYQIAYAKAAVMRMATAAREDDF